MIPHPVIIIGKLISKLDGFFIVVTNQIGIAIFRWFSGTINFLATYGFKLALFTF